MSDFLIGPTGRRVYFAAPFAGLSPAQIIREVATGLGREQRFAGHLRKPYSVLQHSLVAARNVREDPTVDMNRRGLGALMHDASEAYLRDIPKPLKELLPDYKVIEERFQSALFDALISPHFSFSADDCHAISEVDAACQVVEADLLGYGASTYGIETGVPDEKYIDIERTIQEFLRIEDAYNYFIADADGLVHRLRNG